MLNNKIDNNYFIRLSGQLWSADVSTIRVIEIALPLLQGTTLRQILNFTFIVPSLCLGGKIYVRAGVPPHSASVFSAFQASIALGAVQHWRCKSHFKCAPSERTALCAQEGITAGDGHRQRRERKHTRERVSGRGFYAIRQQFDRLDKHSRGRLVQQIKWNSPAGTRPR